MKIFLGTIALLLQATYVLACSPTDRPLFWHDKPIEVAADGSFVHAGDIHFGDKHGGSIVDLGREKVAQRISDESICGLSELLMYTDCNTQEVIQIRGEYLQPYVGYSTPQLISLIQAPLGAVNVNETGSVEELVAIANANDYSVILNVEQQIAEMRPRNRFDPFNGCKIFYPESRGARQ